jgi:predicted ester cyclase
MPGVPHDSRPLAPDRAGSPLVCRLGERESAVSAKGPKDSGAAPIIGVEEVWHMGQARELMDRMTETMVERHDIESGIDLYADNAVLSTPDMGEIRGRDRIAEYWHGLMDGFPDGHYETINKIESDGKAVDEGYFVGTNTQPLKGPDGQTIEPTGKQVKLRSCDVATVQGGKITEHHLYFDEGDFMRQLGLNG